MRGDDPLRIQQRAGHQHFSTTSGYIRSAEELRDGFGKPFPELPDGMLPFARQRQRSQDAEQARAARTSLAAQRVVNLDSWRNGRLTAGHLRLGPRQGATTSRRA